MSAGTEPGARWYLDTSAALKLLVEEPESGALVGAVREGSIELVGTRLLETELRRVAHRVDGLDQDLVTGFLDTLDLFDLPATLFRQAGLLPEATLRSLDALHLSAAIALDVDALATYDARLGEAAALVGVPVVAPR